MQENLESIDVKQDHALIALLEQPSLSRAAEVAGIGKSTLFRYMQDDDFRKQYMAARRDAVSQAVGRLQRSMTRAVDALDEIVGDRQAPPYARIVAARAIITQAIKGVEVEDLLLRLEELEEADRVREAMPKYS